MKTYFKIVFLISITAILIGFILPCLISSESTELVLAGLVLIIGSIPATYYVVKKIIKGIKNEKN